MAIRYDMHMHSSFSTDSDTPMAVMAEAARKRERDLKNRLSRRDSFLRRRWKQSRNGNPYLKYQGHLWSCSG